MNAPLHRVISFSGGRTSAYMLRRELDKNGGVLPEGTLVSFANTGREMPATLDFVAQCESEWGVHINWLEYRWAPGGPSFEVVNHNSASRNGEPFEMLLRSKSMLPNPVSRFCTTELKIMTQKRFLISLGWRHWISLVGLRADEPKRVERALDRERTKKDRWHNACPLADDGITVKDVNAFWRKQPFDLELSGAWEGNCDGCFLKSRASIERMFLEHPRRMQWWSDMEATPRNSKQGLGAWFRADREPYAVMAKAVRDQGRLNLTVEDIMEPCVGECGV